MLLVPNLSDRALAVAKWGEVLTDRAQINLLRRIPWVETEVYVPASKAVESVEEFAPMRGFTRAGPANREGYVVTASAQALKRELYILRLGGSADAYLGKPSQGKRIYKIGLSASPELRKQSLQSALPDGAFRWEIHYHSGSAVGFSFYAAVAGEDAMKRFLFQHAEWLGGEFYLASESDMKAAWKLGGEAATQFNQS